MDDQGYLVTPKWIRSATPEERIKWARIPPNFKKYWDFATVNAKLKDWLEAYVPREPTILLLHATSLAGVKEAVPVIRHMHELGRTIRWISANDYVVMFKEEWDEEDKQGDRWRQLKYIQKAFDVLVIDGLGEEASTPFEQKVLGNLIKTRYEKGLTTVITSPKTAAELTDYGTRVAAYIGEGDTIYLDHGKRSWN